MDLFFKVSLLELSQAVVWIDFVGGKSLPLQQGVASQLRLWGVRALVGDACRLLMAALGSAAKFALFCCVFGMCALAESFSHTSVNVLSHAVSKVVVV